MPPKRSQIWKFFRMASNNKAFCMNCGKVVTYSGNTTNLKNHMKRHHPQAMTQTLVTEMRMENIDSDISDVCNEDVIVPLPCTSSTSENSSMPIPLQTSIRRKSIQPAINEAFTFLTSFDSSGKRAQEVTEAIVEMIYKDSMPINAVEGNGFVAFLKKILPHYKIPSRKTIRNLIDRKYEVEMEKVKAEIRKQAHLCLTTDIWTDTVNTVSYLGLTAHYLENGKMKSAMLGVHELNNRHTAEYISGVLSSLCQEWSIDAEKVVAVVTDNGSNIIKAVRDIFGQDKHLNCIAHTINLIAMAGITNVDDVQLVIGQVKAIVTFFKHSVVATDRLRQLQMDDGIPINKIHKLKSDVVTRWNSTYYMIDRFINLSHYVGSVLLQNPRSPPMISGYDLDILREIRTILSPLEQITRELSGQKYTTISSVIPMLNCIKSCLSSQHRESKEARDLCEALLAQVEKRFQKIESCKLYAVSTLLDPRFKRLHFRDSVALDNAIKEVDLAIRSSAEESHETADENVSNEPNPQDIWSHHDVLLAQDSNSCNESGTSLELRQFLAQKPSERKRNPIEVWSSISAVYPNLANIAEKHMCIVATSVPSESMFSKAGSIARERRNRLTGKFLSKLLFLNSLCNE